MSCINKALTPPILCRRHRVADFWIRLNTSRYSVLEAPAAFIRLFEVKPEHHAAVMRVIAHIYEILATTQDAPSVTIPKPAETDLDG